MEWHRDAFTVSTDKQRLDVDLIHDFILTSYWGGSRSRAITDTSIQNSLCFGVYKGSDQVGFARVVTDEVVFSWVGDVFILPAYRKQGLAKWLMECIVSHPHVANTSSVLGTRDAHSLYEKIGYQRLELMRRTPS